MTRLAAILLAAAALIAPAGAAAATMVTEAETLTLSSASGTTYSDANASGARALLIWSDGSARGGVTTTAARRLVVRARGDQCDGAPRLVVSVDDRTVLSATVGSTTWADYGVDLPLANGDHKLAIAFTNDARTASCDRNLRVDRVTISSTAAAPFAGRRFFVDPDSDARRQADAWRATRPADAAQMDKIAAQPQAAWFGDWNADVAAAVKARVDEAVAAGAMPMLVAYDIPQRDCGQYSAGGAGSEDAYRTWIRAFASAIGNHTAAVVLEPDALAALDCLSDTDRRRRVALLRDAVAVLTAHPRVSLFLDGGHARWQPADTIAARLRDAGVADAQGFSLNVANFITSADNASYGATVAGLTGGKHFVIDTSRNGLGPTSDYEWCNPPGRALGARPTAVTGVSRQDASLWIKKPGQSDGSCNGGPPAGQWWADYALGLAQRAAY